MRDFSCLSIFGSKQYVFNEYPDFTFEEAAKPFNLPELRKKAKFIAILTTSGTGSEVTVSEGAIADACTSTNPREITLEEMKRLFEAVYYGTEVNC